LHVCAPTIDSLVTRVISMPNLNRWTLQQTSFARPARDRGTKRPGDCAGSWVHKGEFFETPVGLRKAQLPAATGDTEKYPGARQLPGGTGSTVILTAELETPLRAAESAFRAALAKRNEQLALTKAAIIELAERTSEAGLYAREMQILIGETRFDAWFSERKFACSLAQAKAFIRFSERREKLSDSFRRTLLALPEVAEKREDGEQKKLPKPPVLG
jgi:hypothetical protein